MIVRRRSSGRGKEAPPSTMLLTSSLTSLLACITTTHTDANICELATCISQGQKHALKTAMNASHGSGLETCTQGYHICQLKVSVLIMQSKLLWAQAAWDLAAGARYSNAGHAQKSEPEKCIFCGFSFFFCAATVFLFLGFHGYKFGCRHKM